MTGRRAKVMNDSRRVDWVSDHKLFGQAWSKEKCIMEFLRRKRGREENRKQKRGKERSR